jgi:hypothetical protein
MVAQSLSRRDDVRELSRAVDFAKFTRLLELGCRPDPLAIEMCARHLQLAATVFDRSEFGDPILAAIAARGLDEVIDYVAGDPSHDPLPHGYDGHDVIVLHNILSYSDEPTNRNLAGRCRHHVEPAGLVVVYERFGSEHARPSPPDDAEFTYSYEQVTEWLLDVGFSEIEYQRLSTTDANGVLIASASQRPQPSCFIQARTHRVTAAGDDPRTAWRRMGLRRLEDTPSSVRRGT